MPHIEVVSAELLERELNSRRFLDGLEKAIEITYDTGREACFDVEKQLFGNQIVYPFVIDIGDENHCGVVYVLSYVLTRYRKSLEAIGNKWVALGNPEFDTVDFQAFCAANRLLCENYPEVPKEYSEKSEGVWDFYPFLTLHTHPSSSLVPSLEDLTRLNFARKYVGYLRIYPKPIMIIAGVDSENKYQELLFLQEKGKRPFKKDRLKGLWKEVDEFLDPKIQLLKDIFEVKQKQHYNKGVGYFDRDNGEISFDFDLKDFAYRCELRGENE